jgi:hypothetical protein
MLPVRDAVLLDPQVLKEPPENQAALASLEHLAHPATLDVPMVSLVTP